MIEIMPDTSVERYLSVITQVEAVRAEMQHIMERDAMEPTEADLRMNIEDRQRMATMEAGDPVSDYYGFPYIQKRIIAEEKAKRRYYKEL